MNEENSDKQPNHQATQGRTASICSAVPLVLDPDYSKFIVQSRLAAIEDGYAIAIHGSMTRDIDVIAIPWTDEAKKPESLVQLIAHRTGLKLQHQEPVECEHGRLAWSFMIAANFGDPRYVDFSIMPPKEQNVKDDQQRTTNQK